MFTNVTQVMNWQLKVNLSFDIKLIEAVRVERHLWNSSSGIYVSVRLHEYMYIYLYIYIYIYISTAVVLSLLGIYVLVIANLASMPSIRHIDITLFLWEWSCIYRKKLNEYISWNCMNCSIYALKRTGYNFVDCISNSTMCKREQWYDDFNQ